MKKNAEIINLPEISEVIPDDRVKEGEIWLCIRSVTGKETLIAKIDIKELLLRTNKKKPIVIEAIQYDGENDIAISRFVGKELETKTCFPPKMAIPTLEGTMFADVGDWIIKGINGEFYPCKPDIFAKTYDRVEE